MMLTFTLSIIKLMALGPTGYTGLHVRICQEVDGESGNVCATTPRHPTEARPAVARTQL